MFKVAGLLLRAVSKSIDFILAIAAMEALSMAGWLAAVVYLLISDGLPRGGSIGKRLTGLRVLNESGGPCSIKDSIVRNSTLALGLVLWKLPLVGWLLMLVIIVIESLMVLGNENRLRLGDEIAKTSVVETVETTEEETVETTEEEEN